MQICRESTLKRCTLAKNFKGVLGVIENKKAMKTSTRICSYKTEIEILVKIAKINNFQFFVKTKQMF